MRGENWLILFCSFPSLKGCHRSSHSQGQAGEVMDAGIRNKKSCLRSLKPKQLKGKELSHVTVGLRQIRL